jgi:hypothetical protein
MPGLSYCSNSIERRKPGIRYFKRSQTDSMLTMTPPLKMGVVRTVKPSPCNVTNRVWSVLTQ